MKFEEYKKYIVELIDILKKEFDSKVTQVADFKNTLEDKVFLLIICYNFFLIVIKK